MMMKFPDHVTISIFYNNSPLVNILIYVIIKVQNKNNFTLGPFLSDQNGECFLTREFVFAEMKKTVEIFPMDYSAELKNILNVIDIQIDSKETIEKRILTLSEFYPESSIELKAKYGISFNRQLNNDFKVQKEITQRIKIVLPEL
jgi:hypothetical protein